MCNKDAIYKALCKYNNDSSWAVWSLPDNINELNGKKKISDLSVFDNEEHLISELKCKYIFVGLNPSDQSSCSKCKNKDGCLYRDEVEKNKDKPWYNFHSACLLKTQDYKLRFALYDEEEYWGSFLTDIVPNVVDKNSRNISTIPTREAVAKVEELIETMGRDIVFVAMGNKACTILKKIVPSDVTLKKITHYSTRIGPDAYKTRVLDELRGHISERITCRRIKGIS